jgi:predicted ester cyclase
MKIKINEIFGDGEKLTIYTTMSGTNKGSFMGISPTNKKISVNGIEFVKFKDEKITDHWGVWDNLGMFMQLGLIPSFNKLMKQEVL